MKIKLNALDEFLSNYPPEIRELTLKTRALIQKLLPGIMEIVDPPSKIIAYGFSPKYIDLICAIAPYKTYINLIFSNGTELDDPDKLLTGTGKHARHIKVTSVSTLENPMFHKLVKQAFILKKQKKVKKATRIDSSLDT